MRSIRLEYLGFGFKTAYGPDTSTWDRTDLNRYARWCEGRGLAVPHSIALRLNSFNAAATEAPKQATGESRNAYRRRLRKWRIEKHGSISKKRAAATERRIKEQRWAVWMEQGVPLRDPEAILWLTHKQLWSKPDWEGARYHGYISISKLEKAAGGPLPAGIDYEAEFEKAFKDGGEKAERRRLVKKNIRDLEKERAKTPMERWTAIIKAKVEEAYNAAQFRHQRAKFPTQTIFTTKENQYLAPAIRHVERLSGRRGKAIEPRVVIPPRWYRRVYLKGLHNIFGPGTLVLDAGLTADGQRTHLTVAVQPHKRRYEIKTVYGYLMRDENGNPKLSED